MKHLLCLICVLVLTAVAWSQPSLLEVVDWQLSPQNVVTKLSESSSEPELKNFGKTGVPYVTATIQTLGNSWDGTLYFDEDDTLNQVLLQLNEVNRSQVTRIQKLAVSTFGKKYETAVKEGASRTDTNFEWVLGDKKVLVSSVRYKGKDLGLMWVKVSPASKNS